jgi:hypothetical protein
VGGATKDGSCTELVGIRSTEIGAKSLFDGSTQIKLKYIKIEGYRFT